MTLRKNFGTSSLGLKKYWAYEGYGGASVKEWDERENYLLQAEGSSAVFKYLSAPFTANSYDEARKEAERLFSDKGNPAVIVK